MPSPSFPSPVFSVVIPTYGRARLLARAIDSVRAQTFRDFELLVVDDGSGDETASLIESIADPRIVCVRRETTGGCAAARNSGILRSRGRYVAFLDDDDEYLPDFLAETCRTFAASERAGCRLAFTWCGIRLVHDTPAGEAIVRDRLWRLRFDTPQDIRRSELAASRIGSGFGLTVERDRFAVVGLFDESLLIEDTDLVLRLLAQGFAFDAVPSVQVKVHRHAGARQSRRALDEERLREQEQLLVRYAGFLAAHPEIAANLRDTLCFRYYLRGDRRRAHGLLVQRLRERSFTRRALRIFLDFELIRPLLRLGGRQAAQDSSPWTGNRG